MRPHFERVIHIEGMDLAGKSTATALLSKKYGGTVRHNSLVDGNEIYELADRLRRTSHIGAEVLGYLYAAGLARDLESLGESDKPTIQDSTILLRSAAFYRVRGDQALVEILESMVDRHPLFGVSVVLTASIDARRERLAMRRHRNPEEIAPDDLAVERDPDTFLAMESALVDRAVAWFGAHVIDTTELDPREVVDQITNHLPNLVPRVAERRDVTRAKRTVISGALPAA